MTRWHNGLVNRILLVEDEAGIADILRRTLTDLDFELVHAGTLAVAREHLGNSQFCAVLLDLSLPDGSGMDLCREIRATSTVPVLILTARRSELDRILGLELGADDYIVKPFSPREVAARVTAVLRRQNWEKGTDRSDDSVLQWRELVIDETRHEVRVDDRPVSLTRTEFAFLTTLMRRPGRVFPRQQLIDAVWDGAFIQDRVVDSVVSRLRRKLGSTPDGKPYIRTVHGVGYAAGE
jgi:DNA-binding response OmpR family regulator